MEKVLGVVILITVALFTAYLMNRPSGAGKREDIWIGRTWKEWMLRLLLFLAIMIQPSVDQAPVGAGWSAWIIELGAGAGVCMYCIAEVVKERVKKQKALMLLCAVLWGSMLAVNIHNLIRVIRMK